MAFKRKKTTASEADADAPKKSELRETLSTVFWALVIAFVLRTFLFQPFHIPSGSMLPGLMKGDYVITSKYSVGYGKYAAAPLPFPVKKGRLLERGPERGDVIVFRPEGSTKTFIKRVVGLPGDQIQMRDGTLHINGVAAPQTAKEVETFRMQVSSGVMVDKQGRRIIETLPNGVTFPTYDAPINNPLDATTIYTVSAGHYFMMGDNRDYSQDSRVPVMPNNKGGAGYVPREKYYR